MTPNELRIHFRGGPLGGETQVIAKSTLTGRRLRVPALMQFPNYVAGHDSSPLETFTLVEEYELGQGRGYNEFEARWIHPQEGLIRENRNLKKRLRDLERAEILLDSLRELKDLL